MSEYGKEVGKKMGKYEDIKGITSEIEDIKNAVAGVEVRGALASGLKKAYDDASIGGNANMEVAKARGDSSTLGNRLDKVDDKQKQTTQQLADIVKDLAPYNVKEFGAMGDGVTDDSDEIQSAVDEAYSKGGGVVFLPYGEYILQKPIYWKSNVSLIGSGVGKSILKTESKTGIEIFSAIENISQSKEDPLLNCSFIDFEIDGSGIAPKRHAVHGKGIFILYMRRALFKNLYIHDTNGTGLGCDFLDDTVMDSLVLERCGKYWTTGNIGGAGIGVGTGAWEDNEGLTITNCHARDCGNYGIFCEYQWLGTYAKNIIISNCVTTGGKNVGIGNKGNRNMIVTNCTMTGNANRGYALEDVSKDCILSNCIITDNGKGGVELSSEFQNLKIDNCIIARNGGRGIRTRNSWSRTKELTITNNKIFENVVGIEFVGDVGKYIDFVKLENNDIYENKAIGVEVGSVINGFWLNENKIYNNGIDNSGDLASGISISGVITDGEINRNSLFDSRDYPNKTQYKGLLQRAESKFVRVVVDSNNAVGNITNGVELSGTTNVDVIRRFNLGDSASSTNSGGIQIPNRSSSIVVDVDVEGFFRADILLTPLNDLGLANKYWISDVTNNSFKVNLDADPGVQTARFMWRILD